MSLPKTPALVAECVLFDPTWRVLLITRGKEPFRGGYALPAGLVEIGETVEEACRREVKEETGVEIGNQRLRFIGIYSEPGRDPRGHTVSVAYAVRLPRDIEPQGRSDAESAGWVEDWRTKKLAFNGAEIVADAEAAMAVAMRKTKVKASAG
jgi:8-oxo-dGTP diphosphatase